MTRPESHASVAPNGGAVPSKPKLLFLSHRLPFPPHNGAALRTLNILRLLARHYEIHALCFDRLDEASRKLTLASRIEQVAAYGSVEVFPIEQQQSRWRLVRDHALSLFTGRAYVYFVHASSRYERRLGALLREQKFAVVHVDSLDLVRMLPLVAHLPCVVTHHNVESSLLTRRAAAERSWWRRAYITLQARLLRREEVRALPRVALNVAVSDGDAEELRRMSPEASVIVVPNGVDTDFFAPHAPADPTGCVCVGGTNYFPNRDALSWFTAEVVPELRRLGCVVDVTWVGRATEREVREYDGRAGVRLTGYVEDVRPFIDRAACFIAPLRVGGGTRLKLLDAWSMGKAIVSTSLGCEGLRARDGENMLIRDDARGFARAIATICADANVRRALEQEARQTALADYSWSVLEPRMIEEYRRITLSTRL